MLYFGVIFVGSLIAVAIIVGRYLPEIMKQPEESLEVNFVLPNISVISISVRSFIVKVKEPVNRSWEMRVRPRALFFSEKLIRRCRIVVLKVEGRLFELMKTLRRKNGELNGRIIPEPRGGDDQDGDGISRRQQYWDKLKSTKGNSNDTPR